MKVTLIQSTTPATPEEGLAHLRPLVLEAAKAGADLIITPEGSNLLERDRAKFDACAPFLGTENGELAWAKLAEEAGTLLLVGSLLLRKEGQKAFNRSYLFSKLGETIATYDKVHLFDVRLDTNGAETRESDTYEAGKQLTVVDLAAYGHAGFKLGLSICYDIRFPALYRRLAQAGANIIAVPSAFTATTGRDHWDVLTRARAIETGAYILAPAQAGHHDDGRGTWGHSRVIDPWGRIVAERAEFSPGIIMAELDGAASSLARRKIPAWSLNRDFDLVHK